VTDAAWVLLGVAAVFAVGDWVAVSRQDTRLEYVCKPATTAALIGVAATLDATHDDRQRWFVAALVLSLAGDVLLMLPQDRFVPGLASFLLAHVAYTVGFALDGGDAGEYAIGAGIMAIAVVPLAFRFLGALRRSGDRALVVPVVVYIVAIAAMGASAIASGNAWAIGGAALFITSDSLIAETRFVRPRSWGRLAIMVTYHLGQAGLVLSLV
jgi:uncharacterized membrane protein YhhN